MGPYLDGLSTRNLTHSVIPQSPYIIGHAGTPSFQVSFLSTPSPSPFPMALRLDVSILVALIAQAIVYGCFQVSSMHCMTMIYYNPISFQVMFVAAIYVLLYAYAYSLLVRQDANSWLLSKTARRINWTLVMTAFVLVSTSSGTC